MKILRSVALFSFAAAGSSYSFADDVLEEVVVHSHPLSGEGLSQATETLQGAELQRRVSTSIGDTLSALPGVHSSTFGKAVSRPVIHGLGGPRIKVMEDRIDTLDVSVTSADHAVGIDPFIAESVEVLKGASTLLYGSGAIGGVVDVHSGRIPHNVPEQAISGGLQSRFDANNNGVSSALKLNGAAGSFAWHADLSIKDGDEYEIPGFAESARLHATETDEPQDPAEQEGRLPGSQFEKDAYAIGVSRIADWGFVGLAVSKLEAQYGLPGGHGHDEEHGEEEHEGEEHEGEEHDAEGVALGETPILDMEQQRIDFEMGIENPFSGIKSLNLRAAYNDYEHQEIEPDGEVATNFGNQAWEARLELMFENENWHGAVGTQFSDRSFSAIGEEAFIPPVDSSEQAVFALAERNFETYDLEIGARLGRVKHDSATGQSRDFTNSALSAGLVRHAGEHWTLGLLADFSSRAPVGEELFSNGPHLATRTFEVGNADLDTEKAMNAAATINFDSELVEARATAYYTQFNDYIYQQFSGAEEDELPVAQYQQSDARFYGIDSFVRARVMRFDDGELSVSGRFDWVDAKLDAPGQSNLPRIPPARFALGIHGEWGRVSADLEWTRALAQNDAGANELATDAYNELTAFVAYTVDLMANSSLQLFVQGKNLTDDEQRLHTSFIKDLAPAPGRTIEAGISVTF